MTSNSLKEFESFYKDNYHALWSYAISIVQNPDIAEDVVQDTLERVWVDRKRILSLGAPLSYVYQMVKNNAINQINSKTNQHIPIENHAFNANLWDYFFQKEVRRLVSNAIGELPHGMQEIMILATQGYSNDEIASIRNTSPLTIKKQKGVAKKLLLKHISKKNIKFSDLAILLFFFSLVS